MNNNPNQDLIDWLEKQEDKVCAMIFTRDDADTWRGVKECEDIIELTDDEWGGVVDDFSRYFIRDYGWEFFEKCVPPYEEIWNQP